MLQMSLFGGSPPSEIGAFQQISEVQRDLREMQEELASNSQNSIIYRATAAGTILLRDIAYRFSPVDTGTLRTAHTAETEPTGEGAIGIVFIHPDIVNPVYHKKPSVYGIELIMQRGYNWHEQAMEAGQEEVTEYIAVNALDTAIEIFAI